MLLLFGCSYYYYWHQHTKNVLGKILSTRKISNKTFCVTVFVNFPTAKDSAQFKIKYCSLKSGLQVGAVVQERSLNQGLYHDKGPQ
jgi:hypothetical protein